MSSLVEKKGTACKRKSGIMDNNLAGVPTSQPDGISHPADVDSSSNSRFVMVSRPTQQFGKKIQLPEGNTTQQPDRRYNQPPDIFRQPTGNCQHSGKQTRLLQGKFPDHGTARSLPVRRYTISPEFPSTGRDTMLPPGEDHPTTHRYLSGALG